MKGKVFLIGYMGVGKSFWGERLAHALDWGFIDTDTEIEQLEGLSISQIFTSKGEAYFREKELELLQTIEHTKDLVVSTGGGMSCEANRLALMKASGKVIQIKEDLPLILNRLENEALLRPKIAKMTRDELVAYVVSHLQERKIWYDQADYFFTQANRSEKACLTELVKECLGA